jgi:hypothetical protein
MNEALNLVDIRKSEDVRLAIHCQAIIQPDGICFLVSGFVLLSEEGSWTQ